jgi:uncharacterized membrane protein YjgN (DUF898 family)
MLGRGLDVSEDRNPANSLMHGLEDGPLKRELGWRASAPAPVPTPMQYIEPLRFSGTGGEYFRIWVVNLLLTLATLGVYSAWAKVRKARWFAQHTSLAGDRFDFHGDPLRILLGRLVALLLLLAWTWGFEFSLWLGLGVLLLFCIVGPVLFASAQRFKLANTSWRGLRFGFEAPRHSVYLVCVPLLLLWTAGTVLEAAGAGGALLGAALLVLLAGMPWAHARLKRLQHNHARFGTQPFGMQPSTAGFYGLYIKAFGLMLIAGVLVASLAGLWGAASSAALGRGDAPPSSVWLPLLGGLAAVLLAWLMTWPYFAARSQQLVWGATQWGAVCFRSQMRGAVLWRLVLVNMLLVLLTAGLYWPFAAVAVARYRVQSLSAESNEPLAEMNTSAPPADEKRSVGDGAADFFGLDLGW